MSPIKLSLYGSSGDPEESFELDDELVGKLRETVDAHDDFTMGDAFQQGLQHVVDHGPMRPSVD
jgi:hypothetical protein